MFLIRRRLGYWSFKKWNYKNFPQNNLRHNIKANVRYNKILKCGNGKDLFLLN